MNRPNALTTVCVICPSICTTFEIIVQCFPEEMLCGFIILACLTEVPCQTSCPDWPLETAQATHYLRRRFFQCVDVSCRMTPRGSQGLSSCIVFLALFALRCLVDDYELGDESVSLLTVQIRCAFVHPPVPLFGDRKMKLTELLMRSSLFCCSSWSSNRSPDARKSAWIAGACGATSEGLSQQIV